MTLTGSSPMSVPRGHVAALSAGNTTWVVTLSVFIATKLSVLPFSQGRRRLLVSKTVAEAGVIRVAKAGLVEPMNVTAMMSSK